MKLLRVCRGVLRELKLASPAREGGEQWRYIASAVRLGKTQHDEKALTSYLTYLQSCRQHRELLNYYQGKGERSLEDSARLVGLTLQERGMKTITHAQHGTETKQTAT